jgi:capsid portal protein
VSVGLSQDITFATANVSTFVAETQVFGPERTKYDEVWNKRFVQHPQGLGLKTVALRSRSPVVTNPEILIRSLTALNVMGAVTPRLARIAANDILQINLDPYPLKDEEGYEPWMDEPLIFATKTNSGSEGIDPTGKGNTHAGQETKPDDIKALEQEGDPSPKAPEHGSE